MKLSKILFEEFVPSTEENVEKAKAFIKQKWNERAKEYGREEPTDLSGACKFASMFAKLVFGGELRGNKLHQFVELDNRLIDLTAGSSDVVLMKEPYKHDKRFWNNPEHKRSMQSCEPRAKQWAEEFVRLYQNEVEEILYHVTSKRRLRSILRNGLKVQAPKDMEDVAGVYLFGSKDDAEEAVMNWLGDRFDEDEELVLIKVDGDKVVDRSSSAAGYEVISTKDIPKEGIIGYETI